MYSEKSLLAAPQALAILFLSPQVCVSSFPCVFRDSLAKT